MRTNNTNVRRGFTIVELLVVVVVIGILATITIVSYNGISNLAKESSLKTELKNTATQLQIAKVVNTVYPVDLSAIKKSATVTFAYTTTGETFCLAASTSSLAGKSFYVTDAGYIQAGTCP